MLLEEFFQQMALGSTHLSIIVMIVLSLSPVTSTVRLSVGNILPPNNNRSLIRLSDFYEVFSALFSNDIHLDLQLLFDFLNKDTIREVKTFIPDAISGGLMLHKYDGDEITLKQILKRKTIGTTLTVPLCTPLNILTLFRMIKSKHLESHFTHWLLVVSDAESLNQIASGLENLLHEGTRVSIVYKNSVENFFLISSRVSDDGVVRLLNDGKGITKTMMTKKWKENLRRLVFPDDERLYLDMRGREMKVAANDFEGFFSINQETQQLLGIDGAIVETLGYAMNFTYKIVRPPDGYWGNPLPDGTVSGVIGMAARWEAAFSICAIAHTELRDTVVDFTVPYFIEPLALFSRAPQEKNKVLAILAPFELEVWVSLIAGTLAIGPLLSLQSVVSDTILKKRISVGLQEFSFNMFRTLTIQGNRLRPHLWSQRILFFSWYIFCLVFIAMYSGMLTAVLAIPAFEKPIDSLLDLPRAVKNGYTLGVLKDTANEMLFREATSGIYRETWLLFNHKNPEESFVPRPEVGIERRKRNKIEQRARVYPEAREL
ncbi:glutamate receptor ionotropic, delta-1-like [Palaemon carinicauda]|uniref:glutamate receptor ionotropic, delta-1-like n=1 Tax=Palaemon carinicauda TaxID=392227 RepID=UPI0035B5A128